MARVELDGARERVAGSERCESGERLPPSRSCSPPARGASRIEGLPAGARVPVRPVKGQILRLRDPAGPGLLRRVLRFRGGYLVPRGDGRYVLGATVEERGFALAPTAGGVYELLRDAHELVPGVSELEIEELSVGLRPGTPDNAPAIGAARSHGLIWATGHYRNGILLAPLTAELVVGVLAGARETGPRTAGAAGRLRARSLQRRLRAPAPASARLALGATRDRAQRRALGRARGRDRRARCSLASASTRRARGRGGRRRRGRAARGVGVVRAWRGRARRGAHGDAGRMIAMPDAPSAPDDRTATHSREDV